MKRLPKLPYLQNIVCEYHEQHGIFFGAEYANWLKQFRFKVPVKGDYLEFPDDFSDEDLLLFALTWS